MTLRHSEMRNNAPYRFNIFSLRSRLRCQEDKFSGGKTWALTVKRSNGNLLHTKKYFIAFLNTLTDALIKKNTARRTDQPSSPPVGSLHVFSPRNKQQNIKLEIKHWIWTLFKLSLNMKLLLGFFLFFFFFSHAAPPTSSPLHSSSTTAATGELRLNRACSSPVPLPLSNWACSDPQRTVSVTACVSVARAPPFGQLAAGNHVSGCVPRYKRSSLWEELARNG